MALDPAFGNWFAGFTDGEGCFAIDRALHVRTCRVTTYRCVFRISLRDDDTAILHEIQEQLGIGVIRTQTPTRNQNPWSAFSVHGKGDCQILRDCFRTHPLRAKKAKDFAIWSQALDCWLAHKRGDSWEDMILLKKELQEVRTYRSGECAS